MKKLPLAVIFLIVIGIMAAIGFNWLADHPLVAGALIGGAVFLLFLIGWLAGQVWQTWFTLRLMRLVSELYGHQAGVERTVSDRERKLIEALGRGAPRPELPAPSQTIRQFPMIEAPHVANVSQDDEIMA